MTYPWPTMVRSRKLWWCVNSTVCPDVPIEVAAEDEGAAIATCDTQLDLVEVRRAALFAWKAKRRGGKLLATPLFAYSWCLVA
jgi:hypothetical protein